MGSGKNTVVPGSGVVAWDECLAAVEQLFSVGQAGEASQRRWHRADSFMLGSKPSPHPLETGEKAPFSLRGHPARLEVLLSMREGDRMVSHLSWWERCWVRSQRGGVGSHPTCPPRTQMSPFCPLLPRWGVGILGGSYAGAWPTLVSGNLGCPSAGWS